MRSNQTYFYYRDIFREKRLPLAFVDLNAFDANVAYVAELAKSAGKTFRLGSKSIRSVEMMRRIFELKVPAKYKRPSFFLQVVLNYNLENRSFCSMPKQANSASTSMTYGWSKMGS